MKIVTPQEWEARERTKTPAKRTKCTKYQMVNCLTAYFPDLLQTLRTAYAQNSDLQFYWNTVNDLDRNNEDFKTAVQALGITEAQLDEIFEKIEGEEPATSNTGVNAE